MEKTDNGLELLVKIYLDLNKDEKEKVIRLAEGLLNSQKVITGHTTVSGHSTETNLAAPMI